MPKFSTTLFEERKALVSLFDGMTIAGGMSEPWRIDYHPDGRGGRKYFWAYVSARMTRLSRIKSEQRRKARRAARQAWRNYAALNYYKLVFDGVWVTLYRKGSITPLEVSLKVLITMHPRKVIAEPGVLVWVPCGTTR